MQLKGMEAYLFGYLLRDYFWLAPLKQRFTTELINVLLRILVPSGFPAHRQAISFIS